MKPTSINTFINEIWSYYRTHKRPMPWRDNTSPYYVVVSEIMLQQTQVSRVMQKFGPFIQRYPNWQALATAKTADVLKAWSGLGYNRRALYLKRIAEALTNNGKSIVRFPRDAVSLRTLPGIGPNTAGSILAFAFNIPLPFIETNIRSVFIHHFFTKSKKRSQKISDTDIMPFIEACLAYPSVRKNPRDWYYALMDYGAHLKAALPNPSRQSRHHVKQKPFRGSNRELRSKILKLVLGGNALPSLHKELSAYPRALVEKNISALVREGFFGV